MSIIITINPLYMNATEKREEMDKQNIVVTYNASSEQKALLLEVLGSDASLSFLKGEQVVGLTRREDYL